MLETSMTFVYHKKEPVNHLRLYPCTPSTCIWEHLYDEFNGIFYLYIYLPILHLFLQLKALAFNLCAGTKLRADVQKVNKTCSYPPGSLGFQGED